ncbi:PhoD-like phosphatase-domain-containing protein [Dioszegia hungarica]|uniref:PhoD-like phosphatase-domain-containing protein n=1 Tax=Dioszegia hungarica TaxID=4972 RepID=A0AA38HBJ7_9TREE|nr:PhoD-like phosphatase-domain-containing protein [Dioszegia hungarica]KAI9637010.1 PhoD-like phosphatase-domain-containing protein [Dioszegia hungarica]
MLETAKTALTTAALVAAWSLRWNVYVFLRLLPFASKSLPKIWTGLAVHLSALSAMWLSRSKKADRRTGLAPALGVLGIASGAASIVWAVAVDLVLVLMSLDMCYRAHYLHPAGALSFSRTGFVTDTSASLLFRSTSQSFNLTYVSNAAGSVKIPVHVPAGSDSTVSVHIDGLQPGETYSYISTAGHEGSFLTARAAPEIFSLVSTSCQKPNWPYSPLNHPLRVTGMEHLDKHVGGMRQKPEMMLFLGDFIYSDLPMPLAPYTKSYYRQLYRQLYASPSWTRNLLDLPWIHMFDDHEIINDYSTDPKHTPLYPEAIDAFAHYQLSVNPPPINPAQPTYTSFNIGQVAFFVLDNRSFRSAQPLRSGSNSTGGQGERTMLGVQQLADLRVWVDREGKREGRLLVLVSGVPVTRNWSEGGDEFDSWAGYLDEREEVLEMLWAVGGAVIISGDRHEHATTVLPPSPHSGHPSSHSVIEFSTSPLSYFHQPWLREHVEHRPTDITLHHEWRGMSRFGAFDFDTSGQEPKVDFTLVVDGEEEWKYTWWKGKGIAI